MKCPACGHEPESHQVGKGPTDTERLDFLQAQLAKGWGDGFAMLPLDSGAVYPRPWRKAMMADPLYSDWAWFPTVRDAIDSKLHAIGPQS